MVSTPRKLVEELEDDADVSFSGGRTNNILDIGLLVGAIVASASATVLAIAEFDGNLWWLSPLAAALPGGFTVIHRAVDFRGRATCYFMRASRLRDLSRCVKHQTMLVQDAVKRYGEIDIEMEKKWTDLVSSAIGRTSRRN